MTTLREPTKVLVISDHPALAREIQTALSGEAEFVLVGILDIQGDTLKSVQAIAPDIILLDAPFTQDECFTLIDELSASDIRTAIVAILPEALLPLSERVMLAGARAFLVSPFTTGSLFTTLKRMHELMQRSSSAQPVMPPEPITQPLRRNVVVFSPKGGAGCTTVAINLAIALRQEVEQELLLVDGKANLGHVALMLNLRTGNSMVDLIPHAGKLDSGLIRQVKVNHVSGISVLPSLSTYSRSQNYRTEDIYKIILGLQAEFQNIVVDAGSYLDDNTITYMDTADRIVLVINPNLASLRDARQFLDLSHSLSYSSDKVLLLVNMVGRKADVRMGDIEKVLRGKVIGSIPADEDLALSCLNEGVPVILKKPGHPMAKAYKAAAKNLVDHIGVPRPSLDRKTGPLDLLRKSSRLG